MVPDVNMNNDLITLIIPDNEDVHVDAALKQIPGSLDALGAEGWVHGIFSQKL